MRNDLLMVLKRPGMYGVNDVRDFELLVIGYELALDAPSERAPLEWKCRRCAQLNPWRYGACSVCGVEERPGVPSNIPFSKALTKWCIQKYVKGSCNWSWGGILKEYSPDWNGDLVAFLNLESAA